MLETPFLLGLFWELYLLGCIGNRGLNTVNSDSAMLRAIYIWSYKILKLNLFRYRTMTSTWPFVLNTFYRKLLELHLLAAYFVRILLAQ